MDKYIMKQLVKDKQGNQIFGYELLFESNDDSLYNSDVSAADAVINFLLQNNKTIFDDRKTFITLTPTLLFRNTPKMFNKDKVIIQIGMSVIVHPLSDNFIKRYYSNGYSFAIDDFRFSPKCFGLLDYVDYVKINLHSFEGSKRVDNINNLIEMAHGFGKKVVATDIKTKEDSDFAKSLDFDYIQGTYIGEDINRSNKKVDYLQSNFFRLVVEISKEDPDIDEIEQIISTDAGLSFALLKLANSINFGLKNKTTSIRQGIVTIGIRQLKQWVYLLTFVDDQGEINPSSEELLKLSFLRATFASALEKYLNNFVLSAPECYIMGMFSTLDLLMNADLEEILSEINVDEKIYKALTEYEGPAGTLLKLLLAYEKGEWKEVKFLADELDLPNGIIAQCYMNCVEEVNTIWKSLIATDDEDKATENIVDDLDEKENDEIEEVEEKPKKKTTRKKKTESTTKKSTKTKKE